MRTLKTLALVIVGLGSAALAGAGLMFKVNLELPKYKNEVYWGGSQTAEIGSFVVGGWRVMEAQKKIAKRLGIEPRRVFHAKQIGCVTGKLVLTDDRWRDTQGVTYKGMFDPAKRKSYDVIMRFSDGVGFDQDDKISD